MKSILFLITCSLCAFCCFAPVTEVLTHDIEPQELACGKCNKSSCKGCKGGILLVCGDDEDCPCGCGKKNKDELAGCGCKGKGKGGLEMARKHRDGKGGRGYMELAGCGCKGKGKGVNQACSSCKKKKRAVAVPVAPSATILSAC